ncbi:hypothetical protein BKA70DRAFT_1293438, partial [Coprinopsis sp. MPI-PUGE-AT-0042]
MNPILSPMARAFPPTDVYETWDRSGWEVVVFKDPSTGRRRGWYLNGEGTVQLIFTGFDNELGVATA